MTSSNPGLGIPAVAGWGLLLLAVAWSLRSVAAHETARSAGWKWWGLTGMALVCFRWPALWIPHAQNPDESQLIAGAITLRHDPVFWRAVDGSTAGPLDFYPLLPTAWADGSASYAIARFTALIVGFGALVLIGEALALVADATLARVAILPLLTATAFTANPDFTHYSTELMPLLLLAAALYLAVRQMRAPGRWHLWAAAVLLGSVPWAKLQAVPIAAALWLSIMIGEYRARRRGAWFPLVIGGLLPAVVCFGMVALAGEMENMVVPYFLHNFAYLGAPQFSWLESAEGQWQNALTDGYLAFWLTGTAVFLAPAVFWLGRTAPPASRRTAGWAMVLFAISVLSALGPRRPSGHHLQLLLLPLVGLTGTIMGLAWQPTTGVRKRWFIVGLFLGSCLFPQFILRVRGFDPFAAINAAQASPTHRQLVSLVRVFSDRGESLAVWGWRCALYVETGRRQATRQAQTELQIYPTPLQPYFLRRYLEDFTAAQPPVFADAVGPGNFAYVDRNLAHESFPPLREWVRTHYTQIADLDGTRLYVRNDRLTATRVAAARATAP
jgi:hypothetical protein